MSDAELSALTVASANLLYMSETDEPFQAFTWTGTTGLLTKSQLLALTETPAGTPVEEVSLDEFFGTLTTDQTWFQDDEKQIATHYRALRATLESDLTDLKVFRVGVVNITIYIVGKAKNGDYVGVQTKAVEI